MGDTTRQTGNYGEQLALTYLRQQGLRLVQRNFSCRMGEIDLIMVDRSSIHPHVLVFVEVRFRSANHYGGAAASVTPGKQKRLIRTAKRFLQLHRRYRTWPCRFDVVAISRQADATPIEWIKSAFTL